MRHEYEAGLICTGWKQSQAEAAECKPAAQVCLSFVFDGSQEMPNSFKSSARKPTQNLCIQQPRHPCYSASHAAPLCASEQGSEGGQKYLGTHY